MLTAFGARSGRDAVVVVVTAAAGGGLATWALTSAHSARCLSKTDPGEVLAASSPAYGCPT
jgi:hypothetical protein